MRKLTQYLLWAYVFTTPWDNFPLPFVGTVSRAAGLAVVSAAVLTTAMEGRLRKPDAVLWFAIVFSAAEILSLLWTIAYGSTVVQARTLAQLVASVWVIREFVRTREQVIQVLVALCAGMFVPLIALINNFRLGDELHLGNSRYSALGINADGIGLLMALGLPIAWHLIMQRSGIVRVAALIFLVIGPVGLLLTGTRGAFVAAIAAAAIVPLSLPRQPLRSYALAGGLLILATLSVALVVPRTNWERILSISSEITEGGRMSGRREIWNAGLQAFPERPLLGAGVGAYGEAVTAYAARDDLASHNVVIGLLVEQGIVGLALFGALFGACAWTVFRLPPPHRALWGVLIVTWLIGGMTGDPTRWKITWVLIGLVSAQRGLTRTASDVPADRDKARCTARESLRTATI